MIGWEKLFLGIGPILAGTFAIALSEQIHESIIKFFNIKDYHLKPLGASGLRIWGIIMIVLGWRGF